MGEGDRTMGLKQVGFELGLRRQNERKYLLVNYSEIKNIMKSKLVMALECLHI